MTKIKLPKIIVPKIIEVTAWYVPFIMTVVLGAALAYIFQQAVTQRQYETARNKDYIERTEKEMVIILEAISDTDNPQMIAADDLRVIWTNPKFRKLFGVTYTEAQGKNFHDLLPEDLSSRLTDITENYTFEKTNPKRSLLGHIIVNGESLPVLVTFISVERSWTVKNDGYFVFSVLPSEEKVTLSHSL